MTFLVVIPHRKNKYFGVKFLHRKNFTPFGSMVMLLKFQVKNFKQFENLIFDFENVRDYKINKDCLIRKADVLKTALIYGPNASGKSNIGLAIFDIVQHLFDHQTDPIGYSNYLNADNPTEAAWF